MVGLNKSSLNDGTTSASKHGLFADNAVGNDSNE